MDHGKSMMLALSAPQHWCPYCQQWYYTLYHTCPKRIELIQRCHIVTCYPQSLIEYCQQRAREAPAITCYPWSLIEKFKKDQEQ